MIRPTHVLSHVSDEKRERAKLRMREAKDEFSRTAAAVLAGTSDPAAVDRVLVELDEARRELAAVSEASR